MRSFETRCKLALFSIPLGAVLATSIAARSETQEGSAQTTSESSPKEASRSAGHEASPRSATNPGPPPRPPLPADAPIPSPPWERHIEVGASVAFIARPATVDGQGNRTDVRYEPALGFGVQGRWDIVRYLRFMGYFVNAHHKVTLPRGSLGQAGDLSMNSMWAYSLGARLSPTYPFSERGRVWLAAGIGWGRLEFDRMLVNEAWSDIYLVRERTSSFVEIPVSIGASYEIVPRWLSVEVETTFAFVRGQEGNALHSAQAIDTSGQIRSIGSFPALDASLTQTLGLSLIL